MSSGKQNGRSYRAGTKRGILHSHCVRQTPQQMLPPSQKPGCRLSFISLARAENFSPLIKEGIIANMAEIPTVILSVHVCVCVRECDLCVKAMKKPIVVMQVCLISVYTTMSVVLWSPLVRLLAGLCCDPGGNAEGRSVRVPWMTVLSETDIGVPVCLVTVSSSSHPQAQRLGCLLIYGGEAPRLQDRVPLLPSVPARAPGNGVQPGCLLSALY